MAGDPTILTSNWRTELPTLVGRSVTLREVASPDLGPLVDLLSLSDATKFGIDSPVSDVTVQDLIDRAIRERAASAWHRCDSSIRRSKPPNGS
jgi:hypothetical protein